MIIKHFSEFLICNPKIHIFFLSGLRPRVPKETEKPPAKSNGEKCRDYRVRLQIEDPAKDEERKEKNVQILRSGETI